MIVRDRIKSGTRVKYNGPPVSLSTGEGPRYGLSFGPSALAGDRGILTEDALTEFVRVTFPNGYTSCRVTDLEVIA